MISFEIMRERCLFLPSSFSGELKVTNSALGLPAKHPLLFAALNKVRTVVMMMAMMMSIMMIIMVMIIMMIMMIMVIVMIIIFIVMVTNIAKHLLLFAAFSKVI